MRQEIKNLGYRSCRSYRSNKSKDGKSYRSYKSNKNSYVICLKVNVAIMRPAEYIERTEKKFRDAGFNVISIPFLRLTRVENPLKYLNKNFDFAIVTSQTSAKILIDTALEELKRLNVTLICIGPKTSEIFEKHGFNPLIPSKFDSKTLYEEFREMLKGKRVTIFRSDRGDPILMKLGEIASVTECVLYRIEYQHGRDQEELIRKIVNGELDYVVFSSRMMVRSFFSLAEELGLEEEVKKSLEDKSIAIGPPTFSELIKYGISAKIPDEYTFDAVVELLRLLA